MKEIKDHKKTVWAIAHDADSVFHPVKVEVGNVLTTGQPFLEQFDTEEEMVERLIDLTGSSDLWPQTSDETE